MSIKIKSADKAALIITTIMSVMVVVLLLVLEIELLPLLISVACFAIFTYMSSIFIISKFVLYRLKPIYEIILNKDVEVNYLSDKFENKNVFSEVKDDLVRWAENRSQEIIALKETENYRKEFLGNVSHELKTPLFTLQGYVLTLLDGGIDDPNINTKYLQNADHNIERLIAIVKDLEFISELEQKVVNLERTKIEIISLCRELAESLSPQSREKQITISVVNAGVDAIYLFADKVRVEQLLINLLVNSIKYGKQGGATQIKFVDMYQKVMIEVEDNGIGIAEDHLPRIFERFYRADKSRSRQVGGTGLGLSIAKHIAEAHGDKLNVRSELGKGTTFSFTLKKYL